MFFLRELPSRQMIDGYVSRTNAGSSDDVAQALSLMRQASQLVRLLDAYFHQHGLSQLKFLILVVIDREPERQSLRQSEINERLDVSKPVLHRTVASMLKSGLILRNDDPDDARAHRISLSELGTKTLMDILPGYFEEITDFMEKHHR